MKIILYGATGMVGQGVLLECLEAPEVSQVLAIGRQATSHQHAKLQELSHQDFTDYSGIEAQLGGYDACFFCLGVSAAGMSEEKYRHITYDLTLAAARTLGRLSPGIVFCYVSGAGTDSSEQGRAMWARVKGKTENDLLALPDIDAYMFRPGYIQPVKGVKSKHGWLPLFYAVAAPLYPLWKTLFPRHTTTSEHIGRAMLHVVRHGHAARVLHSDDINDLAQS